MSDDSSDDDVDDATGPVDRADRTERDDLPAFPDEDSEVPDVLPERDPADPSGGPFTDPDAVDDVPTVSCTRCDREWDLAYELDELSAGNRAIEQFAMDHERHTGHYPDGVTPWIVDCRTCPEGNRFLAERPARRFARTHARHTGHAVSLSKSDAGVSETIHDRSRNDPGSENA